MPTLATSMQRHGTGHLDMDDMPGQAACTDMGDASLVVHVARGSQAALAECYRRHGGPMYRLAQRLLGDDRLAEDTVQEVFLLLWQRPENFEPDRSSLRSWLLMKVHGRAVDLVRAESSRRAREDLDGSRIKTVADDLEREVWQAELAQRVQRALHELPEPERRAITLAYFGGHSYREVARLLGRPEGTVKSNIRNGMINLRRALGDLRDVSDPVDGFMVRS